MRDLQKDLEICNKATQGPWYWTPEEIECDPETGWWGEPPSVMLPQVMGDDNGKGFVVWSNDDAEFIAQAREGWPHAIERAIKAEAEVERLRMALDKIANPLKYMQMEARAKGAELNGVYAIMLSKDPNYLQEIALAELDGKDINVPSKGGER
jgi:hypothetical protein